MCPQSITINLGLESDPGGDWSGSSHHHPTRLATSTIHQCNRCLTIFPSRQIRWIPPTLAPCCHLCYASSVRPLESPFCYVIESALHIRLVYFKMEVVMINIELFVFAYLSSSFVMRDINPKNSKKTWLRAWVTMGLGLLFQL